MMQTTQNGRGSFSMRFCGPDLHSGSHVECSDISLLQRLAFASVLLVLPFPCNLVVAPLSFRFFVNRVLPTRALLCQRGKGRQVRRSQHGTGITC